MRVYVDTGLFIDYLSGRGIVEAGLRSVGRRGRSLEEVLIDAERVLERVARRHEGATSVLTYSEAEEALYKSLAASTAGVAHVDAHRVAAARSIVPHIVITIRLFNVRVLDLTFQTVEALLRAVELQTRGIRAADALHLATASRWNADVVLTADEAILQLDNVLRNDAGNLMRCYDSDDVLGVL